MREELGHGMPAGALVSAQRKPFSIDRRAADDKIATAPGFVCSAVFLL